MYQHHPLHQRGKKKPSTSTSYSVPSSVICHFDSCPGEQRSKLPTPSLLSHKCSGWEEKKTKDRALGHPNTHQDLQGRKRKKNQRIWYTPNSGSLGQTNTQWAIKSPCTKKGAFQVINMNSFKVARECFLSYFPSSGFTIRCCEDQMLLIFYNFYFFTLWSRQFKIAKIMILSSSIDMCSMLLSSLGSSIF